MSTLIDRLLSLWLAPPADPATAEAAFRAVYADPLTVNDAIFSVADLVQRAYSLHTTYADLRSEPVDVVEAPGRLVVGFRMHGRHVGPLATLFGTLAGTGRAVQIRVIDILTVEDGLVTGVWMISDDLDLLRQLIDDPTANR
ncbi:ester cyclase [Planotetraspora sp. GP83]|uniref:ester cyclase n=1 Tax=Planotetraspora sp. GP83 TaxID=3156264 RepID=UPI003516D294